MEFTTLKDLEESMHVLETFDRDVMVTPRPALAKLMIKKITKKTDMLNENKHKLEDIVRKFKRNKYE